MRKRIILNSFLIAITIVLSGCFGDKPIKEVSDLPASYFSESKETNKSEQFDYFQIKEEILEVAQKETIVSVVTNDKKEQVKDSEWNIYIGYA